MARLNTRPALAGLALGAVGAIAVILLPATALESIVLRTHLASVLSAAEPPLGFKARVLLGLIPLVLASALGFALGLILGRRKRIDPYGDYGDYADYENDTPVADPFAPASPRFATAPAETVSRSPFEPAAAAPAAQPEPVAPPPAPVLAPAPAAAQPAPDQLDTATAADLAEIAEAVVRLDARLDSIEAKLDEKPAPVRGTTLPTDLAERLAKIAKSLDAAG